jgi:AAA domain (dynein-related subfamily)
MAYTEVHKLVLTKQAQRNLQEKVIENQLTSLLASINTKSLAVRGWTLDKTIDIASSSYRGNKAWRQRYAYGRGGAEYIYEMYLTLTFTRADDKKPQSNEMPAILRKLDTRAQTPGFGKWSLESVDDEKYTAPDFKDTGESDLLGYAEIDLPENWPDYFSHLYGLDSHIARIRRALEAGIMSNWTNRYHCALVGPPGCGKSDICQSIKRALGEDAVLEFDATATTAAGAMKELSEREILPRILLVEEIEKADEKAMSFLLSVLDLRSEIRKVTARATIQRDTKLFAIATVNDVPLFTKLQAGALESRFANKLWFRRPSREQLALILTREVNKISGNPEWINHTLDYCEYAGITDPRTVTAICLCGRDMLLTGEYQKMLSETAYPEDMM